MIAKGETPQTDRSAGLDPPNKDAAPGKKNTVPKINLSAGLVPKGKSSAAPADRSAGVQPPSRSSSADSSPAAKRKNIAPKINLASGLIFRGKSAASAVDRQAGVHPPSKSSSTGFSTAARRTERGRPAAAAASAKAGQLSREDGAEAQVESSATPKPAPEAQQAVRPRSPFSPHLPDAPPTPSTVQPRVPGMHRAEEFIQPEPQQPVRGREPQPDAVSPAARVAPKHDPETPPAQSWERASNRLDHFQPETAPEAAHEPEPEETPYNAATRMSGLRNLIFSLGLKNLHKEEERRDEDAESVLQPGRGTERQVFAKTSAPTPASVSLSRSSASDDSPTLVTAPPEILPPKPAAEKTDKERTWTSKATARRDRRDAYDDVEILPSWRGQYKKK
jgi:hypothetical protein